MPYRLYCFFVKMLYIVCIVIKNSINQNVLIIGCILIYILFRLNQVHSIGVSFIFIISVFKY